MSTGQTASISGNGGATDRSHANNLRGSHDLFPGRGAASAFNTEKFCERSLAFQHVFEEEIVPLVIKLGGLKAQLERTDPAVKHAELALERASLELVRQASISEAAIARRLAAYYDIATRYVGGESQHGLRQFLASNFDVSFHGKDEFAAALSRYQNPVIFFNHHNRGPEINGFVGNSGMGSALVGHDFTPIVTKMLTDIAFEDTARLTRFGKPLHKGDDFYHRATADIGNAMISPEGVDTFARQFNEQWANGKVPTICPEGGLRSLHPKAFRSGGIVTAAKAGVDGILLVGESPMISFFEPNKTFVFCGALDMHDGIRHAVAADDRLSVKAFVEASRSMLGRGILKHGAQYANFPALYLSEIAENLRSIAA